MDRQKKSTDKVVRDPRLASTSRDRVSFVPRETQPTQHNLSTASGAFRTQSKEELGRIKGVVYQCTQCSKHDLQISICLKTINMLLEKLENGYTDVLDDVDPVCKRLYFERGYKENRRKPIVKNGDHHKKKSVARTGEVREELKINTASGFSIKLPVLSEPELFGDPQIRWTEILSINALSKNTVALSGVDSKQTSIVDLKTSRIVASYNHGLTDVYHLAEYKEYQLYFQGTGKIFLYKGDHRMIQLEESFATVSALPDGSRFWVLSRLAQLWQRSSHCWAWAVLPLWQRAGCQDRSPAAHTLCGEQKDLPL